MASLFPGGCRGKLERMLCWSPHSSSSSLITQMLQLHQRITSCIGCSLFDVSYTSTPPRSIAY